MAQINIEPRPRRSVLPFVIGLLLVAAIAVGVVYFMGRDGLSWNDEGAAPAAETSPIDAAPPAGVPPDTTFR